MTDMPQNQAESMANRIAQLEAELREAQRLVTEMEERGRSQDAILSNISHDLRTPLTAITSHAEILRMDPRRRNSKQREICRHHHGAAAAARYDRQRYSCMHAIRVRLRLWGVEFSIHDVMGR